MTPNHTHRCRGLVLVSAGVLAGCTHTIKVDPIRVEPIDITLHIYLEADKKLDSFFSDPAGPAKPPATPPAAGPGKTQGATP
jgi:hypothetical protein